METLNLKTYVCMWLEESVDLDKHSKLLLKFPNPHGSFHVVMMLDLAGACEGGGDFHSSAVLVSAEFFPLKGSSKCPF